MLDNTTTPPGEGTPAPESQKRKRGDDREALHANCCSFIEENWKTVQFVEIKTQAACSQVQQPDIGYKTY